MVLATNTTDSADDQSQRPEWRRGRVTSSNGNNFLACRAHYANEEVEVVWPGEECGGQQPDHAICCRLMAFLGMNEIGECAPIGRGKNKSNLDIGTGSIQWQWRTVVGNQIGSSVYVHDNNSSSRRDFSINRERPRNCHNYNHNENQEMWTVNWNAW